MAKLSSNQDSASPKIDEFERKEEYKSNWYFDNEVVERLMYRYVEGACTDVSLRDQIMEHASELIRQLIKAHNLGQIYPGKEESSIGDLFQVAWLQIEGALYKYEAHPHCSACFNKLRPTDSLLSNEFMLVSEIITKIGKCPHCKARLEPSKIYYRGKSRLFNLWSQIARTVILAHIKKENRDKKNGSLFQEHLENRRVQKTNMLERFQTEARLLCQYNKDYLKIIDTLDKLYREDEKPHEGLIGKLVEMTSLPRLTITSFLKICRLRSYEFTDSPINEEFDTIRRRSTDQDQQDGDN
jgi:hypothetical protein